MNLFGVYAILAAVVDILVEGGNGFHSSNSSIAGISFTIMGVIGAFIISAMLDRNQKYLITLKILSILSLITCALFTFSLQSGNAYILTFNMALFGLFVVPV